MDLSNLTSSLQNRCFHLFDILSTWLTVVLLLAISCFVHCCQASCNQQDRDSLISFNLGISPTMSPLNWSVSMDCCFWEGVGCDNSGRVTSLWLPSRGLAGTISPSILNLTSLSQLSLSHNQLSGSIPDGFFSSLNRVRVIDLSHNHLLGELPLSDKLSTTIQTFNLSSNHFYGTIKSSFLQPALNLESFDVSDNSFTGSIPSTVCSFSPLIQRLDFSNNNFSGLIPQGFGRCSNLESLRAGFNSFSGEVPLDIYVLLTLQELYLPGNKLTGPIDERVVQFANLRILALFRNDLHGMIPQHIGRLSNLEQLDLYANKLNGTIPSSLTNCTKLTILNLRFNLLEGELSALDFSNFVQLQSVDLMANSFTGGLPASLFSCKTLIAIRLSVNHLHGEILPEILKLQSLSFLSLSYNNLTNITSALRILGRLKNLRILLLSRCFHGEELPGNENLIGFNALQSLRVLTLGGNGFNGRFPMWVSKLENLEYLNLGSNNITGPIPGWIGDLPNLFSFHASQNQLSGCFPKELLNLQRLSSKQNSNNTHFELPVFYTRDNASNFQYNQLSNMPPAIILGSNNFIGAIPVEIGQIKFIRILDLSGNNFSGSIPDTISNLTNLEKLNLSGNHLSGQIPESLRNLHFLSFFSVANNNLEGPIPTGGQFDTFPSSSFESNPGLCGRVLQQTCNGVNKTENISSGNEEPENEIINWYGFGIGYAISLILVEIAILKMFTTTTHSTRRSR